MTLDELQKSIAKLLLKIPTYLIYSTFILMNPSVTILTSVKAVLVSYLKYGKLYLDRISKLNRQFGAF